MTDADAFHTGECGHSMPEREWCEGWRVCEACQTGAELQAELDIARAEIERLTAHSITLNAIAWKIATALGDVPAGAERIEGNPEEQADRLIAENERLRYAVDPVALSRRIADEMKAIAATKALIAERNALVDGVECLREELTETKARLQGYVTERQQVKDIVGWFDANSDDPECFRDQLWEFLSAQQPIPAPLTAADTEGA